MANRFLVPGGSGNWNNNNNWSATSGGGSGASFPVQGDTVTFDTNSANAPMTVNVSSACGTLTMSNYTGTFTMNSGLTIGITIPSSSITLSVGMTVAGTGTLSMNGTTPSFTSHGIVWSGSITTNNGTYTFVDNWTVTGNFTIAGPSTSVRNGSTVNVAGNLTIQSGGQSGTTKFVMNGTGTVNTSGVSTSFSHDLTFNTAGTITVSGTFVYFGGTLTYTAGTMNITGTLSITNTTIANASNTTFNTSGMTWGNVIFGGPTLTHTLSSDFNLSGLLTFNGTTSTTFSGTHNINASGGLTQTIATVTISTGTFVLSAGTITDSGTIVGNVTITGNVTFPSTFTWNTGTLLFSSGTPVVTSTTLVISAAGTVTINSSALTFSAITVSGNTTFNGSFGWIVTNFTCNTAGTTITLKSLITYEITGLMTMTGTLASPVLIKSTTGGSQAILTLDNTASASADVFCNATDIDSSQGQTIISFGATLTNTINWNVLTVPPTISYGQVA